MLSAEGGRAERNTAAKKTTCRRGKAGPKPGEVAQGNADMNEISSIHQFHAPALVGNRTSVNQTAAPKSLESLPDGDIVEVASIPAPDPFVAEQSSLRTARLAAIKGEIAAGTYETPWRIRGTVERLLDVIA